MEELIRGRPEYEMRLYTLSLVKTSISFWERQDIKTEVQNFFSQNCNYEWNPIGWHEITQKVLNFADACCLVATTLLDLKDAIINTGMKMFDWIMYVHWDYGLDITHALPILWTPLGFVDEDKIFKSIWVNDASLYHDSPDKPIFRLACLLAQEDFIREHASEMIEELKKLPMEANSHDVELEVVNYSDKVYGIMSTYICYFVNRDWQNKDYYFYASGIKESKEFLVQEEIKMQQHDGYYLRSCMEEAMNEGLILPPVIMAELSGWPGLFHAVKYYLKKLNSTQKKEADQWLLSYFGGRTYVTEYNTHCRAWRFWETYALVAELWEETGSEEESSEDPLCWYMHVCPLESVLWPMVRKSLNIVESTCEHLNHILQTTFNFMEVDQYLGIPNTRYFYQKLVKKIFATYNRKKMLSDPHLIRSLESYCGNIQDFTWLRIACESNEVVKLGDAEYSRRRLFAWLQFYVDPTGIPNFEAFERFFEQLFFCADDRIRFLVEVFPQCLLLRGCEFDMWEKLYYTLNIMPGPLRNSIDPLKCLRTLATDSYKSFKRKPTNIEKCDEFIKWWHESNPNDQANLKEKFRESLFPSECIYEYWIGALRYANRDWAIEPQDKSLRLLQWLYDSEDEISKFKKEKLSVLGLLVASFTIFDAYSEENKFHAAIDEFLIFYELPGERLGSAKDEIRSKIEELSYNFLTVRNIETFYFLMNWLPVSEDTKKKIFKNLMDSSKFFKLCENILNCYYISEKCMDVFYNEWILKYCDDISKIKRYLISNYKGVRSERFMSELKEIYETLERGERLENLYNLYNFG